MHLTRRGMIGGAAAAMAAGARPMRTKAQLESWRNIIHGANIRLSQ